MRVAARSNPSMDLQSRSSASSAERVGRADSVEQMRLNGNCRFKAKQYDEAALLYSQALAMLPEREQQGRAASVILGNRAAARLGARRYEECLEDCELAVACANVSPDLGSKLAARKAKATAKLQNVRHLSQAAKVALTERSWAKALELQSEALTALGAGQAAIAARAAILCDRSEVRAAVGDWNGALADAALSVRTAPSARAQSAFARVSAYVEQRQIECGSTAPAPDTGLAPGSSSLSSVQVIEGCKVILREVYLCTTGGRLWQAALLLANHLLSDSTNCDAIAHCRKDGSRLIEVGAGLGLVGLALAAAVAGCGCTVTLTDCEGEALDNLRQEVLLNSHRLIDTTSDPKRPEPEPDVQLGTITEARDHYKDGKPHSASSARTNRGCDIAVAELNYGPQHVVASSEALTKGGQARYDFIVGSDVIFSETHASLSVALSKLMALPNGRAVLCLADNRVGIERFLRGCEDEGLLVSVQPITSEMLAQARVETDDDDLGTEAMGKDVNTHSLYHVRWGPETQTRGQAYASTLRR
jgi:predicted nicotinamide N-methyase